jgi:hypothetical protein
LPFIHVRVVVVVVHDLVEELDGKHRVTVVLEDKEMPNFNGVRAGELPPAVVEVHLPDMVEQHLHGPHAGCAASQLQYDLVGLLPIDDRRELLGEAQPVPLQSQVDGDDELEPGEIDGWRRTRTTMVVMGMMVAHSSLSPNAFLSDLGPGHA